MTLFLVATPIGNLADITFRAIETLSSCDYILCEDTRHTQILLKHYGIGKPLKSFHKFNEKQKEDLILQDLQEGKVIALVSDAGTPGISDPGTKLVQRCINESIPVVALPGACAAILALSCSGLDTSQFQFYGFLPRKSGELRTTLQAILGYTKTTICYESPHRLLEVLRVLSELAPTRNLVVARELTKQYEELRRGTAQELLTHWSTHILKGEIVLLIEGGTQINAWEELSPEEHVAFLEKEYKLTQHEAIKMAAEIRGVQKRTIYNKIKAI